MRIPEPNYDRDTKRLLRFYQIAFQNILGELKGITNGIQRAQAESLLRQIAFILAELDSNTKEWVDRTIEKAFFKGQATALISLGEASSLSQATEMVAFSMLARDTVDALIDDTYQDLLFATNNTEKRVKQLVRNVVSETMRVKAIEQLGRRTTRKEVIDKLTKAGLSKKLSNEAWVGIVDKAGRRWNLSTYASVVVHTKIRQAHTEGVRVQALERGVDLAVISSHGAQDACRQFEGLVISMNGLTPGYLTYGELRQSGKIFHPNCQHTVHALRDLSLLPEELRAKHEKVMNTARRALRS